MSESLQFGHHPDGDQISAFVEQALPVHEREVVLGHLAVCPECRAIVALSLPEVEAPASALPVPARKPWWLRWTLALPVAGALAAAVLAFVYLYPNKIAPAARGTQVADAHPAPPLGASMQPSVPAARQALQEFKKTPVESQSPRGGVAMMAPRQNSDALRSGQAAGGPMLTGRNVEAMRPQAAAPLIQGEGGSSTAAKATVSPSSGAVGAIAGMANAPANIPETHAQESALKQTATVASSVMKPTTAAAPPANAAETVAVANGAPINTVSAETPNPEIALDELQGLQLKRPLPSHLAVLSSAVLGKRMVAIDAEHNVFVSKDGGRHWKSVSAPWPVHAAQVSLVQRTGGVALSSLSSFGAQTVAPGDANAALKSSGAAIAQPASRSSAAGSSINGTVMDRTGALIPGATVTATEIATGAAHAVKTDGSGHYSLNGLSPGNYRVEGQSAGFKKREIASVDVKPTGSVTANLILDVSESTQAVTVEADSAEISAPAKKQIKSRTQSETGPVFEIVTESGDRWTSVDGLNWQHN
jgi:hypothetical protein